jgi:hypothetical protein
LRKALAGFAAFAALTFGADITGKWSGPMEMNRGGETRADSAYLVLKQEGAKVTGTVGPTAEKQMEITEGIADGDSVTISANIPENGGKLVLKLKLDGDKLKGDITAKRDEGDGFTGTMTLSKVE